jgi:hypothetical protein
MIIETKYTSALSSGHVNDLLSIKRSHGNKEKRIIYDSWCSHWKAGSPNIPLTLERTNPIYKRAEFNIT